MKRGQTRPGEGPSAKRAFTIVELLVVMSIMIIVIALLTPAITSLLRGFRVNKADAMISDELNYGRQIALTRNREVEVRFYRIGSKTDANDKQYRAFRLWSALGKGETIAPLTGMRYLPEPVILSGDAKFSTLLDQGRPALSVGKESLPDGSPADYVSFKFRATGGTNLTPITGSGSNWYLTFFLENAPVNADTGIPSNYGTAQIDPVTGRLKTYRP